MEAEIIDGNHFAPTMRETPRQYKNRILGYSLNKDPFKILAKTPHELVRLIRGLTTKQLRRRPVSRKWSIAEILAHLADTELALGFRYRQVLSKNRTKLQAYDQNAWAEDGKYSTIDPKHSLAMFSVLRRSNLRLLTVMPRSRWKNYGMHEERGKESMRTIARLEAGHDINHLRQIAQIADILRRRVR